MTKLYVILFFIFYAFVASMGVKEDEFKKKKSSSWYKVSKPMYALNKSKDLFSLE